MATQYSNKPIVTDGLVYALDFGNQKSYVSGSTTANSLIYIPTTASVSSSGLDSQGFLNLENSNFVSTNQLYNLGYTSGYTMIYTVDPKGAQSNREATQITQAGNTDNQRFWSGISSTRISHWFLPSTAVNSTSAYTGRRFPITPGKQHIAIRYSSGSYSIFQNGILVPPSAGPILGDAAAGSTLSIGLPSGYFTATGSFAQFQVYNRALTSDEIWSNYQLSAQRYGIGTVSAKPYSIDENAFLFLSQSGITDPIITGSIDTFVRGLKANNLWDKMIAIYPFVGTGSDGVNLTGSQSWNLKEPTTAFYKLAYNGAWDGSTSGSTPSGSNTYISTGVNPKSYHPYFLNNNAHISILSYDTPVSSSYLMGTGMTEDLAISTLAGDYGTPAAAYSVRKVKTAYSGALMDVRRDYDNVTSSIGFVSNGDLDTGSLLDFVKEYSQSFTVTVEDDGGGNVFVLDGTQKPPLTLFRGGVYTFDQSDVTNTTHPIAFKSGSESYTTGVVSTGTPGEAGAQTVFTVANDTPDDLSYYCTVHGDYMGNTITVIENTGSGFVARWYDQSGNNRHATQTATGSQPLIVESGSVILDNNRPSLTFSSSILTATTPNVASPQSIYAVNRLAAAGDSQYRVYFDGGTSVHKRQLGQNSTNSWYWNAGNEIVGSSSNNSQSLWSALFGGAGLYINGILQTATSAGGNNWQNIVIGGRYDQTQQWTGSIQEITVYNTNLSSNREPIEYNINDYYNIYPQTSSFATSSFTIQAGPTSVSASLNNRLTSGITTSGPLGLITVSRTGSNSLTIARNGVTSSFAVPASGALSTGIYLGAINNNGLALGNSPLNISFASVGTGLTGAESTAYFNLVNNLQSNLNRESLDYLQILAYADSQGFAVPSTEQQLLQRQLIIDLKAAGIWDKLDVFYVFANDGGSDFARINWKDPFRFLGTIQNTLEFGVNQGFIGNTTGILNTGYNPRTNATNFKVYNNSFGYYVYDSPTNIGLLWGQPDSNSSTSIGHRNGTGLNYGITSGINTAIVYQNLSFVHYDKPNFNSIRIFRNGQTFLTTNSVTSVVPISTPFSAFRGYISTTNGTISIGFVGASLLDEKDAFNQAITTYMNALIP
jgi:hypothetical protein